MKSTNFQIVDLVWLRHADTKYDLHNDYSFEGVSYSVAKRTAILKWVGGQPNGGLSPIRKKLEIEFSDVQFFSFSPRDPDMPFSEDDCLETDLPCGSYVFAVLLAGMRSPFLNVMAWRRKRPWVVLIAKLSPRSSINKSRNSARVISGVPQWR